MDRIILLPDHIKHLIAAGEVVEGPFSVVKELVENSLDAGATEIDVQVWDSGLKKISVRDNGCGIRSSDISMAIMEHATSKLGEITALDSISTYGFRGEALSSIASISDMVILSKRRDEERGARLESVYGSVEVSGYMGPPGTTVIAENLFNNVPARKKFLKAKETELRNIRETLLKISLAAHRTAFTFDVDGKRQVTLHAADKTGDRINQVFGKGILDNLYFEELCDLKARVSGFLSRPSFVRNSRNMQFLYINNRPVESRYFSYHLARAYEAVIPRGKYPAAIVFIEIDPELTDVNVHPAKREVRLFDQKYIDELIYGLAKKSLNRIHSLPVKDAGNYSWGAPAAQPVYGESGSLQAGSIQDETLNSEFSGSLFADADCAPVIVPGGPAAGEAFRVLGVVFGTYIVVEKGESMHLVDFHAAHERIIYDRLAAMDSAIESQELLFPATVELTVAEYAAAVENFDLFESAGFEVEEFSDNTLIVRSAPVMAGGNDIGILIKNMIDNIREEKNSNNIREKFLALIACHSARRSGDELSAAEMSHLVKTVFESAPDLRCPHGRPFVYTLSKNDLERMFKRL